jgi:hypothetical protein
LLFNDEVRDPEGFEISLDRKFAKLLGVKLTLIDNEWRGTVSGLSSAKYDILSAGSSTQVTGVVS